MKVIICGAGQVGYQIARHLSAENNNVTVIDQNPDLVRNVTDVLDVGGVAGFASHPEVLERAGARDADMLIAATFSDEINMVACQVAHSVFTVPQKIARIRAQTYLQPTWSDLFRRDHMPIDVVISPEVEIAKVVMRRLESPAAFDSEFFFDGRVRLIGVRLDDQCPIIHTPLKQLTELFTTLKAMVLAVERDGRLHVVSGDDQLFAGDAVYFLSAKEDEKRAMELFGHDAAPVGRVVILGGGNIGLSVAEAIEKSGAGVRAKLIERSRERAEFAAEQLERTIVLNGDGLDAEILAEASISDAGAIVAVTDDAKVNLLSCALAKMAGCERAVALTTEASLNSLTDALGIDALLNPRSTTVSSILRHVRLGRVRAVYSVRDGEAEMIEAQVLATSPIAGKRIRQAGFPPGAIVGAVYSKGEVIMPSGDLVIQDGDLLVVFAKRDAVRQVEQLFRVSIDFL